MSAARDCIDAIRSFGWVGYVKGTTLFGPAFVGLRATPKGRVAITELWVSPSARGLGHGQRILNTCIEQADQHEVVLQVRPCAFGRTPGDMLTGRLCLWYAKHGFADPLGRGLMTRTPRGASQFNPRGDSE